jgi:hypothetical protein
MRRIWYSFRLLLVLLLSGVVLSGCTNPLDRKNVGGLQVISQDTPSSLFLDGQYLDKTPFINKTIKPGTYTLRIEPDNKTLVSHEAIITIRKGLLTVITWKPGTRAETSGGVMYEMEPITTRNTELSFVTIPDSAIITIDEGQQQFAPLVVSDLEPGHHQFEVSLPSYESQKHTINVVKGHRITISVTLARLEETETDSLAPSALDATPTASSSSGATDATPTARRRTGTTTGPTVTITSTKFFSGGEEVLRIRSTPSASGKELGFAKVGSSYPYLGEQQSGWYKIDFDGQTGWASGQYAKLD